MLPIGHISSLVRAAADPKSELRTALREAAQGYVQKGLGRRKRRHRGGNILSRLGLSLPKPVFKNEGLNTLHSFVRGVHGGRRRKRKRGGNEMSGMGAASKAVSI